MKKHLVEPFVSALRAKLDAEGFSEVEIHSANGPYMHVTIERRQEYLDPKVWDKIDYAASNTYDIQKHFKNPDGFDAVLSGVWKILRRQTVHGRGSVRQLKGREISA